MQRASSRKKEVFMKNKSEFFIKHYNYFSIISIGILLVKVYFIKFFIRFTDFACSMISKRFSDIYSSKRAISSGENP